MIKQFLILILFVSSFSGIGFSQDKGQITTIFLVRHAEKMSDGTSDPDLNEDGIIRTKILDNLLAKIPIDAIYSTNYKRTKNTVKHLAIKKKLEIQLYNPAQADYIDKLLEEHKGGNIVIVGHSNTVPYTVNYLLGEDKLKMLPETEYDNLFIVDVIKKGQAKMKQLTF